MTNLFSSFDPSVCSLWFKVSMNWLSLLIFVVMLPSAFWAAQSQYSAVYDKVLNYMQTELSALFGPYCFKGIVLISINTFLFTILLNFMGLMPYVFTNTSHLVFTLSIALPMWIGPMLWSIVYQHNNMLAHLVPVGTPSGLMPVMVIIETVSNIIRPGTLSIRLAANMVAGHLLLTLLGSQTGNLSLASLLILMVGLIMLIILECAVACIQSYVFTVLSSLYLNELLSISFNKKMI